MNERSAPGRAAATLRRLRLMAKPTLSVRRLAQLLDMSESALEHYERRFKRDFLPVDLGVRLTIVLRAHGVPEEELTQLHRAVVADIIEDLGLGAKLDLVAKEARACRLLLERIADALERLTR